jgi:hypothetical protein
MCDFEAEAWTVCDRFVELRSRWLTVIGEHLETPTGEQLEYWRVEKADSVVILPIQAHQLILPPPSYRPGVGQATLDFPGGRVPTRSSALERVPAILQQELGVPAAAIAQLVPLSQEGWLVNSSFSNQKLYGVVAHLQSDTEVPAANCWARYPTTPSGIQQLLPHLSCLQCRAVLLEWWLRQ